ncbi:hypothetical protein Pla52o_21280 [Novipirellula galeiformis]|uniref:Uncharacterized protein n=1 Tax=Novipirellula galeiformis TaxID=2528004 RepID=A0A5C6CIR4_9BACT|nr:hypothetical protein [Novipirellula galeiformis]TWU24202.1 hypothetical protein Pla52o_21280 [Novipirellula galeiformis]
MNTRYLSVVASVTLLVVSSGCGNLKQFWFGRGARCGLCNTISGIMPGRPGCLSQAPSCNAAPYTAPPVAAAPPAGCTCSPYAGPQVEGYGELGCGSEVAAKCPTCAPFSSGYGNIVGDYGYDSSVDQYGTVVTDPYLQGGAVGSSVYGNPGSGMSDNFDARGDRILNIEPLPPGATPAR